MIYNEVIQLSGVNLILCDDDEKDLTALREYAHEYLSIREISGKIHAFGTADEVLAFSKELPQSESNIYLLDVIFPETNGIELARSLRLNESNFAVIFISSSREFAVDAFSVRAFSYLVKPYEKDKLFSELDECIERIKPAPKKLSVKTGKSIEMLDLSDIIAVEYFDHRLIFHLFSGEKVESVYRRAPFDVQAREVMSTGEFMKISTSYLINRNNIRGLKRDEFVMRNGSEYRITHKYISARQEYMESEASANEVTV